MNDPQGWWAKRGRLVRAVILTYLGLLTASHVVQCARSGPTAQTIASPAATVPAMGDAGPVGRSMMRVAYRQWLPAPGGASRPIPVLMLHGSPGSSNDFRHLGPELAQRGYRCVAIDLPGFGHSEAWPPSYSILAHAHAALAAMDDLEIDSAHVIGFSMGGGVGLHMADMAPARVASLTMLSSIGAQEAEGSGSYYFEHGKYALGYALLVAVPEAAPHFGLIGGRAARHAFIRNFWDTDQRPLRALMQRLRTPTLILHGRGDFLVPSWGAELHSRLIPTSRLVMLDAGHFIPFFEEQADLAAAHIAPFLERHDAPGAAPLRGVADFAPIGAADADLDDLGPFEIRHETVWWIIVLVIILGTLISEDATVITVGLLVARGQLDFGVGLLGCFTGIVIGDGGLYLLGRFAGRRALQWPLLRRWLPDVSLARWSQWFDRHAVKAVLLARVAPGLRLPTYFAAGLLTNYSGRFMLWAVIAALFWTPFLLVLAGTLGRTVSHLLEGHVAAPVALIGAIILVFFTLRFVESLFTRKGRRKLRRLVARARQPEFWPAWIMYAPLIPYLAWQSLRRGGTLIFTCINPGIPHGGGVVGESKHQIIRALRCDEAFLARTHFIPALGPPEERAALALRLIDEDPKLGGYPVILKPDAAQRGHALRLARTPEDVEAYFQTMTRPAILQAFHPGPQEVGVLWVRRIEGDALGARGEIFSITRKAFPSVLGDGVSTLEELIWRHPRHRMQAETFLTRHAAVAERVIPAGERLQLAVAGNHCQGTMFLDGSDLITPALTARIDEFAQAFRGVEGPDGRPGPIDFGRFDLRYTSDDALRRGEGFVIIELNGTMSESTDLYDPRHSVLRMYAILFRQWRLMYHLGALRRRVGVRALTIREILTTVREHYRGRPGSRVAD